MIFISPVSLYIFCFCLDCFIAIHFAPSMLHTHQFLGNTLFSIVWMHAANSTIEMFFFPFVANYSFMIENKC